MIGLLGIGLALVLGIGMRIAAVAGVLMLGGARRGAHLRQGARLK